MINLLTKREAELYDVRTVFETKAVPVTLCEDGKCNTYYLVYMKSNNEWTLAPDIKPEYVKESVYTMNQWIAI